MGTLHAWRRWFVLASCAAMMSPIAGQAQQPATLPKVAFLTPGVRFPDVSPPPWSVRHYLSDLGYVDGSNITYEQRAAEGQPERLPALAEELVRLKPDVIIAWTNEAAFAAKRATSSIPIVVWAAHGAVEAGLIDSLAKPGGNLTGVESLAPELDAKRLEILKELAPGLARIGVLYNSQDQGSPVHLRSVQAASSVLHLGVVPLAVRRAEDLDLLLATPPGRSFDALVTLTDGRLTGPYGKRLADFAIAHRIPTACEFRFFAQQGCLIAYGPTLEEFSQRVARQIDRILKGALPRNIPFEQVTRFELTVNLRTARAIGITVPSSVLLRADEVIE